MVDDREPLRMAQYGFVSLDASGNPIVVTVSGARYPLILDVGRRIKIPLKPCYEDDNARCPIEEMVKHG